MSTIQEILKDTRGHMDKAIETTRHHFSGVRSGKASPALLETVRVEMYGQQMPLNQVASINAPEPRILIVTPFDKGQVKAIEKAIRDADLGLNPSAQGDTIRVPTPPLTEERRKEMVKLVKSEAEDAKIAIRNIRRDANEQLKKLVKDKAISEDDERRASDDIQKLTDKFVADVDKMVVEKEKEVLTV